MGMSLVGALGAAVVVCGAASAGNLVASHTLHVSGTAALDESFDLDMFFALSDADSPGSPGYLSGATLSLVDFLNGTEAALSGDLFGANEVLTNGVNDEVFFGAVLPDASVAISGTLESSVFIGQPGVLGPDLVGWVLTDVRVLGSAIQSDGQNGFDASVAFLFYGVRVPSPGVSAMALLAGASLGARRRRRS